MAGVWGPCPSRRRSVPPPARVLLQEVQPALPLPPPLGRVLQSVACRQLRGIYEDLAAEAARIHEGRPTLWPGEGGGAG